jgi:DNA anti-recombination protein RmuC
MGFRTLAIEQRSAEVWAVLGAVKTEFGKFGEALAHTRKKLEEASNSISQGGDPDAPAVAQAEGGRGAAGGGSRNN